MDINTAKKVHHIHSILQKKVVESDEDKPGAILDYGEKVEIVGIEVLNASKN